MRTGIFVGSFNPFTIGHDSIVRRALPLFDRLVIGVVGDNVHKPDMPSAEERMQVIRDLYSDEQRIERHHFIPCSKEDYDQAMRNELPDKWWQFYQKLM